MQIDFSARPAFDDPVQVRGPADLLHMIPYLFGFHPADSFVVMGLQFRRIVFTARCDLADMSSSLITRRLVHALVDAEARDVIAVVYSDEPVHADSLLLPHGDAVAQFGQCAERAGLEFLDALLLAQRRWWSYSCSDESCCPSQGQLLEDTASSAVAAAATVAGLVALPDRDALAAQFDPAPTVEREALQPLLAHCENEAFEAVLDEKASRWRRSLVRAIFAAARRADAGDLGMTDEGIARFGVGLSDVAVRDSVWVGIDERRVDGRELWRLLARRLPAPYDAAPMFFVGWGAWRKGDGAVALIAAQRAVESDPQYTPGDLLLAAVDAAVDPRRMPRIRSARTRLQRSA